MEESRQYKIETLAGDGNLLELKTILESGYTQLEIDIAFENAIAYSQLETADYLLSLGADFSNYNYQGVYYAVHNNELEGLKYSISNGVDVNINKGILLNTAVMTVINTKDTKILKWLLENGADTKYLNSESLEFVKRYRTEEIEGLISKYSVPTSFRSLGNNVTKNFLFALAATIIWFFIMRPFTPSNIIAFELAGTTAAAKDIISNWSTMQISRVETSIYFDFGFILAYCSAFMFGCRAASNFSGIQFFIRTCQQFVWIVWLAGVCDAIENIALLKTLSEISQTSVSIAFYAATVKFGILLIALIFILISLVIGIFTKAKT